MSTKAPVIHRGFATGIKHWHVAQIEQDLFALKTDVFNLIECNAGAAFVEGRKSTFVKAIDLMKLHQNKTYVLQLCEMGDFGKLNKALSVYLNTVGEPKDFIYNVYNQDQALNLEKVLTPTPEVSGLIYIDPPGSIPPFHIYSKIGMDRKYNRYDFLLNLFPRSWKRHLGKKEPPSHIKSSGVKLCHLPEYLSMLNREHWYVRDSSGLYGAILLFGTNRQHEMMSEWEYKIDMFSTLTDRGASILARHSELQNR